ncbi:unnamed protein product, partial [Effrenium voratum]
ALGAQVLCPDQVGFGLTQRPTLRLAAGLGRAPVDVSEASAEALTPLQLYSLAGNALIAEALLPEMGASKDPAVIVGHSMGAISASALALRAKSKEKPPVLILESPAFLAKPEPETAKKKKRSGKVGPVTALALRFQRTVLRLVLQLPGFTYNRRFWQRGLALAYGGMDPSRLEDQVLRYRWPSLCEGWALGLANFVTARLLVME